MKKRKGEELIMPPISQANFHSGAYAGMPIFLQFRFFFRCSIGSGTTQRASKMGLECRVLSIQSWVCLLLNVIKIALTLKKIGMPWLCW